MMVQNQKRIISLDELRIYTPKQIDANKAMYEHKYVLYGGARGGGKSFWLRWALLDFLLRMFEEHRLENLRVMLASETYPILKDRQISKIKIEFPKELGVVKNTQDGGFGFYLHDSLGGGVIALRNLDDPSKYQSAEFAAIAVDELTKNTKGDFDILRGSLRWPNLKHTPFIAATNPGGIGHAWVKDLWIDNNYSAYPELAKVSDQFHFIQSLPRDNPHLEKSYWEMLKTEPEQLRKAWLEGDWDAFEGMAFPDFSRSRHVLPHPIELQEDWPRWRAIDWGYASPFCCLWFCKNPDNGRVYVYRELYEHKLTDQEQARLIVQNTPPGEKISITYADPSMWTKKNLEGVVGSSADEYQREGVHVKKGDNHRLNGKRKVHRQLGSMADAFSGLWIFPQCKNLIRELGTLALDKVNVEDVDTDQDDHAYDALRYGLTNIERHGRKRPNDAKVGRDPREFWNSDIF